MPTEISFLRGRLVRSVCLADATYGLPQEVQVASILRIVPIELRDGRKAGLVFWASPAPRGGHELKRGICHPDLYTRLCDSIRLRAESPWPQRPALLALVPKNFRLPRDPEGKLQWCAQWLVSSEAYAFPEPNWATFLPAEGCPTAGPGG